MAIINLFLFENHYSSFRLGRPHLGIRQKAEEKSLGSIQLKTDVSHDYNFLEQWEKQTF